MSDSRGIIHIANLTVHAAIFVARGLVSGNRAIVMVAVVTSH
jgi:hypothetical protein